TASHNPKEYNGLKFCLKGGEPIGYDAGLDRVEELSNKPIKIKKPRGRLTKKSIKTHYVKTLASFATTINSTAPIVIDASNGSTGQILPELLQKLKLRKIKRLNFKADGRFSTHPPDPLEPKSLRLLGKEVRAQKARIGIIFDADGDRLHIVDEKGKHVRPEYILILLAKYLAKPGQKIVYDLRSSWSVREELRRARLEGMPSKVGRTNIYREMKRTKARLGGELSGHYFFKELGYIDDAALAMIHLFSLLNDHEGYISELIRPFDRYYTSGELNFRVKEREAAITRVYNAIRAKFKDAKIDFLDGLSIECKDWWFNLRPSNTQALIRLVVEARDEKLLDKRVRMLTKLIEQ
ncbi:phosphomannomutase/phosphoglucomutase, partial [Candidatus Woesearchaeota archaeon]|nr:phosphomannomutase/phosphoglucomutase [Candidatus Woesearchaeota archaeon]